MCGEVGAGLSPDGPDGLGHLPFIQQGTTAGFSETEVGTWSDSSFRKTLQEGAGIFQFFPLSLRL